MIMPNDAGNTPLPSEWTYQTSISGYIQAASLGILCWDILDNITTDFKLLIGHRVTIVAVVYLASRIASIVDAFASTVVHTAPVEHCILFDALNTSFYPLSLSLSGLLFFFRLRAIYNRNPIIVPAFFLLWLGLVASTVLIPIGVHGGSIGETAYCRDATAPNSIYAAIMAPLVHDTAVFIAISWRLMQNCYVDLNFSKGFKMVVFGKYLPHLTKSLFIDGQRYYLMTLISNIVTAILIFTPSLPVPLRAMLPVFNVALTNIMACRVYRRTKTGLFRESEIATTHVRDFAIPNISPPRPDTIKESRGVEAHIVFCEINVEDKISLHGRVSRPTSKRGRENVQTMINQVQGP